VTAALYLGIVLLCLTATSWLVAEASVARLSVQRTVEPARLTAGESSSISVVLRHAGRWPIPWLRFEDVLDEGLLADGSTAAFAPVAAGGDLRLRYELPQLPRGLHRVGPSVAEGSGPFGLLRRTRQFEGSEACFLTVEPRTVPLDSMRAAGGSPIAEVRRRSLFEDPSRFAGVRRFRRGDGLRRVHWRATARTGELQSKAFEPAVLGGALICLELGADAWADRPVAQRELAITAAASLAEALLAAGRRVGLLANAADAAEAFGPDFPGELLRAANPRRAQGAESALRRPLEVAAGKGPAQRALIAGALARAQVATGPTLAALLAAEHRRLPRGLVALVVTPRLDAPMAASLGVLRRSGFSTSALLVRGRHERVAVPNLSGTRIHSVCDERELMTLAGGTL